jgi:hypothetical protein
VRAVPAPTPIATTERDTMDKQTTIIEVNGVKLEIDLRSAKRIDNLRVGDRVKCLVKGYGGSMTTHAGIVVGFEPFPSLPSIVVAYLETGYASSGLKFKTFNAKTEDFEVVADIDSNALEIDRESILDNFDRETDKKRQELAEIQSKRAFFLAHFGRYFSADGPAIEPAPTPSPMVVVQAPVEDDDGPF